MIGRGDVCIADLGAPFGSEPAKRRPVVVVQADRLNRSALATVVIAVITSNTALAAMPGNVFVPAAAVGLSRDSVITITQLRTIDRARIVEQVGALPGYLLDELDRGLRLALEL